MWRFYMLTINGDYPAGRPFGVVMEVEEDLYISANDHMYCIYISRT